jgi:hypothetical protein
MERAQMNMQQLEEAAQTLVANDKGLLKMDESNGPRIARSSTTAKPRDSMRKIAPLCHNF